jgi:hypothetical protein
VHRYILKMKPLLGLKTSEDSLYQGCWEREREREAQIFKNLQERERFKSVFYIIHKYIYIYIYI